MGISLGDLSPKMRQQAIEKFSAGQVRNPGKKDSVVYVIKGNPITKKNSSQILVNSKTGRRFVAPSKAYTSYENSAGMFLQPRPIKPIETRINVKCVYYMETHRRVDLANLISATCDILTHYGIISDDNSGIVVSHDGSRVDYDKDNPRAEITIQEV